MKKLHQKARTVTCQLLRSLPVNRSHADCWRGRWRRGERQALPNWLPLRSLGCRLLKGQHFALNFVVLALCFAYGMCTTHIVWDIKPSMTCIFTLYSFTSVLLYLVGVLWGVKKKQKQKNPQHFAGLSVLVYINCKHPGGELFTCILSGPSMVFSLRQPLSWLYDWAMEIRVSSCLGPSPLGYPEEPFKLSGPQWCLWSLPVWTS